MESSLYSDICRHMIEIVFPREPATESLLLGDLEDGSLSAYRSGSGHLWLLHQELSADWISLAALVDETNSTGADVAVFSVAVRDKERPKLWTEGIAMIREDLLDRILTTVNESHVLAASGIVAAAIALEPSAKILEWSKNDRLLRHFHQDYPYCQKSEVVPGIHYPVTDPILHNAIGSQNLDLAERLGSLVLPYTGDKHRGWFVEDAERWKQWFGRTAPTRVLEITSSDGINTNAILDLLFPHPESEVHTIHSGGDLPDAAETLECFAANAAAGEHTRQIQLYTGQPVEVLAWMIADDDYWESFDFIHFKPVKDTVEAMTAAGQAWSLLKPGGILLLDSETARIGEVHPAKLIMETCAGVIGNQADPLLIGDVIALKKRPPITSENLSS